MPINIDYQPSAASVFDAAYLGGFGEYQTRRAQQALQAQQMAMQDAHFRQQLAANLYSQQQQQLANQNSQVFNAERQFALQDSAQQNQADQLAWQRENQVADQGQHREWQLADQKAQWGHADEQQQLTRDWAWGSQAAGQLEGDVNKQMAAYANQKQYMSEEGKRLLGDLTGKLRAIQKVRSSVRPQQYGELLGKYNEDLQRAGLDAHIQKPQTIAERLPSETHYEPVYSPDGEFMGHNVWSGVVRNGQSTLTNKFIPKKDDAAQQAKIDSAQPHSFEHLYSNRETFNKDFTATQKELLAEAKASAAEGTEPSPITHQDVLKAMKEKYEAWSAIQPKPQVQTTAQQQKQQTADGGVPTGWADSGITYRGARVYATPVGSVVKRGDKWIILDKDTKGNVVEVGTYETPKPTANPPPAEPQSVPDMLGIQPTQYDQPPPPPNMANPTLPPGMKVAPEVKPAAAVRGVSKDKAALMGAVLPRVNSKAEATQLPPGTKFIGPDGKVRIVPGP